MRKHRSFVIGRIATVMFAMTLAGTASAEPPFPIRVYWDQSVGNMEQAHKLNTAELQTWSGRGRDALIAILHGSFANYRVVGYCLGIL